MINLAVGVQNALVVIAGTLGFGFAIQGFAKAKQVLKTTVTSHPHAAEPLETGQLACQPSGADLSRRLISRPVRRGGREMRSQ